MAETIRTATAHDRVVRVISHFLGVAEDVVTDDKKIVDIDPNHDSLEGVELVMALEDDFGIEIDDESAERITKGTVAEISAYIGTRVAK